MKPRILPSIEDTDQQWAKDQLEQRLKKEKRRPRKSIYLGIRSE